MRFSRLLIILLTALFIAGCSSGTAKRASVDELLVVTKTQARMTSIFKQIKQRQLAQLKKMKIPKKLRPIAEDYIHKIALIYESEMNWDNVKEDIRNAYTSTYTENEIDNLVVFFKTPEGQLYIEKMPVLTHKVIEAEQKHFERILPRIKALINRLVEGVHESDKAVTKLSEGEEKKDVEKKEDKK
ncbi:MAG: DUF2059 domain-containing protein [Deltaproteobacteria bacterium]|nr:DUF2059 domain-containing protein [Deltaproteobacteria bacterium]